MILINQNLYLTISSIVAFETEKQELFYPQM